MELVRRYLIEKQSDVIRRIDYETAVYLRAMEIAGPVEYQTLRAESFKMVQAVEYARTEIQKTLQRFTGDSLTQMSRGEIVAGLQQVLDRVVQRFDVEFEMQLDPEIQGMRYSEDQSQTIRGRRSERLFVDEWFPSIDEEVNS